MSSQAKTGKYYCHKLLVYSHLVYNDNDDDNNHLRPFFWDNLDEPIPETNRLTHTVSAGPFHRHPVIAKIQRNLHVNLYM